jgi:hypothetical protein
LQVRPGKSIAGTHLFFNNNIKEMYNMRYLQYLFCYCGVDSQCGELLATVTRAGEYAQQPAKQVHHVDHVPPGRRS